jgi:hypothetical protein
MLEYHDTVFNTAGQEYCSIFHDKTLYSHFFYVPIYPRKKRDINDNYDYGIISLVVRHFLIK